jgi:hypothetical protein
VTAVGDLADALHQQVYASTPEDFPPAYMVALDLVNSGVVRVVIDGQPGFELAGEVSPKGSVSR